MAQSGDPAVVSTKYCRQFWQLAIKMGFIDSIQLDAALERQRRDIAAGRPGRLVGAILYQEGIMSAEQMEEVLKVMSRSAHT